MFSAAARILAAFTGALNTAFTGFAFTFAFFFGSHFKLLLFFYQ